MAPFRNHCRPEKFEFARAMRNNPTLPEARLWQHLRRRGLYGARFRRQSVILGFIADFYCPAAKLVVELDGVLHDAARDRRRDEILASAGFRTLRFRNSELRDHLPSVLDRIADAIRFGAAEGEVS